MYVKFISNFDIFKFGKTTYNIDRVVRETGEIVDNGLNEIYINTKVDDGTEISGLMNFFKDSNGFNPKFPKVSERVDYFKNVKEGVEIMCSVVKEIRQEGIIIGADATKKDIAKELLKNNVSLELVEKTTGLSKAQLKELMEMNKN